MYMQNICIYVNIYIYIIYEQSENKRRRKNLEKIEKDYFDFIYNNTQQQLKKITKERGKKTHCATTVQDDLSSLLLLIISMKASQPRTHPSGINKPRLSGFHASDPSDMHPHPIRFGA